MKRGATPQAILRTRLTPCFAPPLSNENDSARYHLKTVSRLDGVLAVLANLRVMAVRAERRRARALDFDMSGLAVVEFVLDVDELALCLTRHELGNDQHLLGLVLELLRELLNRPIVKNVRKAMVHAQRLLALSRALCAQVAQVGRQREIVEVDVVVVDAPRPVGVDGDARLAHRVAMLLLTGDLARAAVSAVFVIDQKSVGRHLLHQLSEFLPDEVHVRVVRLSNGLHVAAHALVRRAEAELAHMAVGAKVVDLRTEGAYRLGSSPLSSGNHHPCCP